MINVADLENRWLKYKIKSYIPHAVIISSIIVITILSLVFLGKDEDKIIPKVKEKTYQVDIAKKQEVKIKKTESTPIKQSTVDEVKQKIPQNKSYVIKSEQNTSTSNIQKKVSIHDIELKQKKEKLLLKPSLNFMRDMQNDTLPYYENDEDISKSKVTVPRKSTKQVQKTKAVQVKQTIEPEKKPISINRQNTQEDIHHVIKRFKINNNPALSLFIAKKYYELGKYNKSYNYALITNEINSNIEASWIIFAKSLVKLNERDMAIKTLKTYFDHSGSNKAKILLDEIITGKFK